MKRIIPLILAVSLVITLFASVSVSAADYDDEYVFLFTEVLIDGIQVSADPFSHDGYATITSTDPATSPFFIIQNIEVPNTQKYVAVKYAAESVFLDENGEKSANSYMWVTAGNDENPKVLDWDRPDECIGDPKLITDYEWHLAIFEISATFLGVGDLNITTFRMPGAAPGENIDIAYVGFFKTEEEAQAYDAAYSYEYDLPSEFAPETKEPTDKENEENSADPTATPDITASPVPTAVPTEAPTAEPSTDTEKSGCGSVIGGSAAVFAVAVAACLLRKKK